MLMWGFVFVATGAGAGLVGVDEAGQGGRRNAREDGRNRPQSDGVRLAHEAGTDQAESQIRHCSTSLEENLTVL